MSIHPRPAWRSRGVPVVIVFGVVLGLVLVSAGPTGPVARLVPPVIGGAAVVVAVWAWRRRRSDRVDYERRLTDWAAGEAVLDERLRIARDLHDLVSHGLGSITVQAAATRHLPRSPEVASALDDIEETSRDAMAELRRMLTVLRGSSPEPGPRAPAEDLSTLPMIIDWACNVGLRPRLSAEPPGDVSPGVQVAVCRTIREALTNVARHAGPTGVEVDVYRDGKFVVVVVADDGPAFPHWHASPGAGHGLLGLRERVGSLGGTLAAEPVENGFRLTARIPDEVSR